MRSQKGHENSKSKLSIKNNDYKSQRKSNDILLTKSIITNEDGKSLVLDHSLKCSTIQIKNEGEDTSEITAENLLNNPLPPQPPNTQNSAQNNPPIFPSLNLN
ncbi:unnamed protein product [Moneuplotes crassus]|uniref:Uncharacterized protein n=1 Tax=Euplotes crassus TaxID=5936 RepID=A0AAD1XK90_EUPCR|nr:unnamed protein product [Moneuplotes crassus]